MMTVAQRIEAFETERNKPYKLPESWEEKQANNCSCSGKTARLADVFKRSGFDVRERICTFFWDSGIVPNEVYQSAVPGVETHVFLEVMIPETGEWVKVDATWDPLLAKAGLPVAEWDGLHSTPLAVKPLATLSVEESARILSQLRQDKAAGERFLTNNETFIQKFNQWLNSVRKK